MLRHVLRAGRHCGGASGLAHRGGRAGDGARRLSGRREWSLPEEEWGDQASLIGPGNEGPRIYFQRVPEEKTAKNRVHLDVRVAGREIQGHERQRLVEEQVTRLTALGAIEAWRVSGPRGGCAVMRDPEGNEFCVA